MDHLEHISLFETNFMPHGHCYFWSPDIVWTNTIADSIIALSYFIIPIALIRIARKRNDINFRPLLFLFGIFIIACGTTHIIDIITIWKPIYRVGSTVKAITALASLPTAIILIKLVPNIISIPSNKEWEKLNQELKLQIEQLKEKDKTIEKIREFEFLADSIPQIIWTANSDGNLDYYNKHWFGYTGMTFEQTKDWGWKPVLHPDDLQNCIDTWTESFQTGKPYQIQYRFRRAEDGSYRWHLGRALPMKNEEGKIVKWFGTCTDIHDFKKSKDALKSAREHLQTIMQNTPIALWSVDSNGIFTFADGKALKSLGLKSEDLIGHSYFELSNNSPELVNNIKRALQGEEFRYAIHYNGRILETFYAPLNNSVGSIKGMVAVSVDETEGKKALAASQSKTRFLANMSHEIRTPLNAIIGFTDVLQKQPLNKEQQDEFLGYIRSSSDLLLKLIGDILDLSRIEEGKLEITKESFFFKEVISSAILPYKFIANEKGLEFSLLFDEYVPHYVIADAPHIKQVMINLISNAMKFTKEGKILVEVSNISKEKFEDEAVLKISASDTGIGIPIEKHAAIFEKFTQADNLIQREFGGSGLGLSIVKQLVNLMEGDLQVESPSAIHQPGRPGTTISFTIKVQIDKTQAAPVVSDESTSPDDLKLKDEIRILLVEDNPLNQMLAKCVLKKLGCSLEIASNGKEAIELLQHHEFDIILMDVQMPIMDGYEATKYIREHLKLSLPVIGLTANVLKDDVNCCFEAGMNDYLGKPYSERQIYDKITKWSAYKLFKV